ncbi:unnamed protein product [Macrosiphum euphorbiae]|uniref:Reverse transcriptase domain-containing protein n=2 Tax=Macrosiphum euphorbiae TaxID=13131 RepID=A0AAV0W7P0_9HEMI|nr:unnamed protein product [Macrosiphum euphorbiae]
MEAKRAMVSIDVANAFNTAPWEKIGEALRQKDVPFYLIKILRDYLRERRLQTDAGNVDVTCGVPQGSVIGPILWNIFHDDLLRLTLPEGVRIIAFADDVAVVGTGWCTEVLEVSINAALKQVSDWMSRNGLTISINKTVAMMMTTKRKYRHPQFVLLDDTLELKGKMRYLGVELSSSLGFKEHIQMARNKALRTTVALSLLMPNVKGPRPIKRKLLASVVHSQLLYAAPVWSSSLVFHNHKQLLLGPQRAIALRVASAYRTVSTVAILVVTNIVPVHLMARGRSELRRLQKTGIEDARHVVDENIWSWWQQEWDDEKDKGAWTKRLIPKVRDWASRSHGVTSYHLTQMLTGHGCFQAKLYSFTRAESPHCLSCGDNIDDAEHTFFKCGRWARKLADLEATVDQVVTPETIIPIMLHSKRNWEAVERYVTLILRTKEEEERLRR